LKKKVNISRSKKNKKTQVFLIFLGLSTIFWAISKLSKEYTHTVEVKINYTNLTSDKELQNKPVDYLELVLKTSGFNLLGYTVYNKKIDIDLSKTQKKKGRYFYIINNNLSSLQAQLALDETILRAYPDTLFFDFGKLSSKKIDIIPHLNIKYKSGYSLVGNLDIKPQKVLINGTEEQIKNITSISTKELSLKNVVEDFEYKIQLDIPKDYDKIYFSIKEIKIKGIVEKFTEASLEIPFQLINVPKEYNIKTFVNKIKLTYKVSLANYDKIQKADFKIICDFNNVKDAKTPFLIPEILNKPNLVSNIKMSPNKIEFLIKK